MSDSSFQNETWAARTWKSPVVQKVGPVLFFAGLFLLFFSPVLLSGRLLAPNDGLRYALPNFYAPRTLWTPFLFGGFPAAADPQAQTWYPLSFLFSLIPGGWNAFMLSAYVLAAWFMFGYVRAVTGSRMSGLVAGLVFSLSGFMVGRLGHVPLIHAAIWLPLLFWALEETRKNHSAGWLLTGSLAIACSFLGGHPQILFYGLAVAGAYVLYMGWPASERRWNYYGRCIAMLVLGFGWVGIQILPTLELANWSARTELNYSEFMLFSLNPHELITLLFPYLFGGGSPLYRIPDFISVKGAVEPPGYFGLLTLSLACLAVMSSRSHRTVKFWLVTFLIGLVLALGRHTPLYQLLFHVPGFNKFRIPIRHFFEMTLAVSVLAGWGAHALLNSKISSRQISLMLMGFCGIFGLALAGIFFFNDFLATTAVQNGIDVTQLVSMANPALYVPLIVLVLVVGFLVFWWRRPDSPARQSLVLLVLVIDLGSFGWFHHWHEQSPSPRWLAAPATAQTYTQKLNASHQRLTPVAGIKGPYQAFPVNISRLWRVSSASGFNPLVLSRVNDILSRDDSGALVDTWSSVRHRGLDLFAVRYIFSSAGFTDEFDQGGVSWERGNLNLRLGQGCGKRYPDSVELTLPEGIRMDHMVVAGTGMCASNIPEGERVVNFRLSGNSEVSTDLSLKMGKDISDMEHDCEDVKKTVRHSRARVFGAYSPGPSGSPCEKLVYVSVLSVKAEEPVRRIRIETAGQEGIFQLDKITFREKGSGKDIPLKGILSSGRWQFREGFGDAVVYENLEAMPRAWLVPEVIQAPAKQVLHAIEYATLPDGRPFDPARVALVEEGEGRRIEPFDPRGTVEILQLEHTEMVLKSRSNSESFLVLSDIFYPGWEATVDGQPASIVLTNFTFRGMWLPAGSHTIHMKFHPGSFYRGLAVTLLSLAVAALFLFRSISARKL